MKKVKVNGKETEVRSWDEFWNLAGKEGENHVVLEEDDSDPRVYIDIHGIVHISARSNWYHLSATHKMTRTDWIIDRLEDVMEWRSLNIIEKSNIYEVRVVYDYPEYSDEMTAEVMFLTYWNSSRLDEVLSPVRKIANRVKKYFSKW
ncbi:MAG: hypothetical protein C0177_00485 [Fervidicoccus fontis]|nr:MAG: hypothetical protein C0177_00485 [Fervidicoccus fontis]